LEKPAGGEDVQRELQVLGLPVLEHVAAEGRGEDVAADRQGVVVVRSLLMAEVGVSDQRLSADGGGDSIIADGSEGPHLRRFRVSQGRVVLAWTAPRHRRDRTAPRN
jgi:hypothetical protein